MEKTTNRKNWSSRLLQRSYLKFYILIRRFFTQHIRTLSAESFGWMAILLMHGATIPSILGLIFSISDRLPPLDVIGFIWAGLVLFFIKALINKDTLNIMTIGIGFMIQAGLLGFIVFK